TGPLGVGATDTHTPSCCPPGVRSWDVDPGVCSLDEQLKVFVSRHSATFSSIVKGQRSLHHRGAALDTLVLLNPSDKSLCDELRNFLLDPAPHKLVVLAGPCLEETGELLLQTGGFSASHLLQVLGDKEIGELLALAPVPPAPPTLTITCPTFGNWAQLAPNMPSLPGVLQPRLNPPTRLPASEGLREFLEYVAESLEPPSPFELLEPPAAVGFLKIARPCCYVFPGGLGDAAFFAVNGFTILVNGGSSPKSSFWKLVRHLDRVDAVLVTHVGVDSLPGLNSLLRRKLAEREAAAGSGGGDEALRNLISPELGVVFLNTGGAGCSAAAAGEAQLVRSVDEVGLALGLLARLGIAPLPLSRGPLPTEPTVLFQKMGVGRLDMYVLHPPSEAAGRSADRTLASACVLLVWQPASPAEKVVRVLFPGCTPPARLLEGLARLEHLGFLREPVVTPQDLAGPRRAESRESLGSRDSVRARDRPGTARREPLRTEKDARPPPREAKKDPRPGGGLRTQPREVRPRAAATPDVKKAGVPASAKARKAPEAPRPAVENGPRSPPERGSDGPGAEETPPTSLSESLPTLSDSEPLPALSGPADSDDDNTESLGVPHRRRDPLKDPRPLPAPPGVCMVDPEQTRRLESLGRARKPLTRTGPTATGPKAATAGTAKTKGLASGDRASRPLSARSEPGDKAARTLLTRKSSVPKTTSRGPPGTAAGRASGPAVPPGSPVYLDLAYLPSGSSARLVDAEFFRRVRALCYVISGQDQGKEEGMRALLDALLAGKQQWDRELQVTLIPTFESAAIHEWYQETHARQQAMGLTVLGSNSTVAMQDESFPACKVEF
ncbi:microtubule-associated protein 1S, partial [Echinops telfairi]|uniref:Microtubule-associated protein 1S n=1 Tax=Echinops telfairi TaxID=9371 RepID=A0ABM0ZTA9_ECHTE